jgi:hypothetical protein
MAEWLIPWVGRGHSGPLKDNFLWRSDRLYVMDNHRLALWCWWQHITENPQGWNFLHIDRHYDALWQNARPWVKGFQQIHQSDLNSFRQAIFTIDGEEMNLYRWDVITSALLILNGFMIKNWAFATASEGVPLSVPRLENIISWNLPVKLQWMANQKEDDLPSIIDIDIDYFTHLDRNGHFERVFSDQYLRELGTSICDGLKNHNFGVVTVALSPSTTGSWSIAEELCWKLLENHPEISDLIAGAPPLNV